MYSIAFSTCDSRNIIKLFVHVRKMLDEECELRWIECIVNVKGVIVVFQSSSAIINAHLCHEAMYFGWSGMVFVIETLFLPWPEY